MDINDQLQESVYRLWDRLAEFPASEARVGIDYLLARVGELIDSEHAFWFSMVRMQDYDQDDPMLGWRMGPHRSFRDLPFDEGLYLQAAKEVDMGKPTPCMISNIRLAGKFRGSITRERMPDGYTHSGYYRATHTARQIRDSMAIVSSLNQDAEVYCVFYRTHSQDNFNEQDLALAKFALRSLNWFQRRVLLSYGLSLADNPLTRTERKVARHLLTELPEKEIAQALAQSRSTTHKHINSIYRKFNVNSRSALLSVWLGH